MMFLLSRRHAGHRLLPFHFPLKKIAAAGRLLLCAFVLLALAMTGARAFAAGSEGASAGKRPTGANVKGRKRTAHQPAKASRRTVTPSAKSGRKTGRPRSAAKAAAVGATAAAAGAVSTKADAAAPELLPRCGFTEASRRHLFSHAIYVLDEQTGTQLYARNADEVAPIASVSKLMTAMVWLDQKHGALGERIEVAADDLDTLKFTQSRLNVGASLTRADMLHIALMSSENRAAAALSRDYPGGRDAFIAAMNAKARALEMPHTRFVNATGLSPENVSTAKELATMVRAANAYQLIRQYSVDRQKMVSIGRGQLQYVNSNRLIRYGQISASVQKTGFINEAGHNMVMRMMVHGRRPVVISMLGSDTGNGSRLDGVRIAQWLNCSLR